MDVGTLQSLLEASEDEHLEFKEANNRFDFELLVKYCCAFANEGGGRVVPRKCVATTTARRR